MVSAEVLQTDLKKHHVSRVLYGALTPKTHNSQKPFGEHRGNLCACERKRRQLNLSESALPNQGC